MIKPMALCTYGMAGKDVTVFLEDAVVLGNGGILKEIQKDISIQEAELLILELQHAVETAKSIRDLEGLCDESNI
ncbi:hypothetical protein LAh9_111 [Aeromonas phage LAh_9]|uniref:Uncharacterized protein n=1 Tax=Aeromonas phage LAh_9 TaxID=2591033 RepID=A0A514A113_9CAUD|nr:hypothetical protein HWC32_gp112 [Aeromonas phage LAh_9]QDH46969.1 hypothetical protein LAh9_111 [Aeromonas phage LAh_9]